MRIAPFRCWPKNPLTFQEKEHTKYSSSTPQVQSNGKRERRGDAKPSAPVEILKSQIGPSDNARHRSDHKTTIVRFFQRYAPTKTMWCWFSVCVPWLLLLDHEETVVAPGSPRERSRVCVGAPLPLLLPPRSLTASFSLPTVRVLMGHLRPLSWAPSEGN
jgi:hypothetical protein